MINMANISDNLTPDVQDLVEEHVAQIDIPNTEQIAMLENLGTEFSFDVDYDVLACDPDYARKTLRALMEVMHAAGRKTVAERMYLNMTAKTLGISKDELEELQKSISTAS
jgi:hypothetical protein